jgi:hypothetical protein
MSPQDRSVTPEKQLLNLIEDNEKEGTPRKIEAKAIRHFGLSLVSAGAWIGRLSFFRDRLHTVLDEGRLHLLDIKVINGFLLFCIFALSTYFIFIIPFSFMNLKKMPHLLELNSNNAAQIAKTEEALGLKRAVSYYLEKAMKRDLFRMGKNADLSVRGPSDKAIEATKHLKLVGISWSDNPDAMIEDSKALRTFFVKRGQMIGDVKIEAIFKDKVILNYSGEDIELK